MNTTDTLLCRAFIAVGRSAETTNTRSKFYCMSEGDKCNGKKESSRGGQELEQGKDYLVVISNPIFSMFSSWYLQLLFLFPGSLPSLPNIHMVPSISYLRVYLNVSTSGGSYLKRM